MTRRYGKLPLHPNVPSVYDAVVSDSDEGPLLHEGRPSVFGNTLAAILSEDPLLVKLREVHKRPRFDIPEQLKK
jgi:hypothetical protein